METKGLSKVTQMVLELDWNPLCLHPRLCGSELRSPAVLTPRLGTPPVSPGNRQSLLSALKAARQFQRFTENFHLPFSSWSGCLTHGPYLVPEQGPLAPCSKHSEGPWLWCTLSWVPGSAWLSQVWPPAQPLKSTLSHEGNRYVNNYSTMCPGHKPGLNSEWWWW